MNVFCTERSIVARQLRILTEMGIPYEIKPVEDNKVEVMVPDLHVRDYDRVRKLVMPGGLKVGR